MLQIRRGLRGKEALSLPYNRARLQFRTRSCSTAEDSRRTSTRTAVCACGVVRRQGQYDLARASILDSVQRVCMGQAPGRVWLGQERGSLGLAGLVKAAAGFVWV